VEIWAPQIQKCITSLSLKRVNRRLRGMWVKWV